MTIHYLQPNWPSLSGVNALITTRQGGVSSGPFAQLNLSNYVGDNAEAVAQNRALLRTLLPAEPIWLRQTHSNTVIDAARPHKHAPEADASFSRQPGVVCAVLTADCLPVLLVDQEATTVAAVHAGWRGLAKGILENTVAALAIAPQRLLAYLGPAIGPKAFEVDEEVRATFIAHQPHASEAFTASPVEGKYLGNLYFLAQQRLQSAGVKHIFGGQYCTFNDSQHFYSFRREAQCGRMASLIWLSA